MGGLKWRGQGGMQGREGVILGLWSRQGGWQHTTAAHSGETRKTPTEQTRDAAAQATVRWRAANSGALSLFEPTGRATWAVMLAVLGICHA